MQTPFDIVRDSSIWYDKSSLKAAFQKDSVLYTGTVRSVANDHETGELRYVVEIHYRGDTIPVPCRMVRRFGGAFNYEDTILRGYNYNTPQALSAKAGDHVLIGLLGGQGREGVIFGGLTHPTHKSLSASNGPEYKSEFNGIETYINRDGEYTLTFKAQPVNLADLNKDTQGNPVPAPIYDTDIGGSYLKWDKTGSFSISDNAKLDPQYFILDKKHGTIELISGKVSLKMVKEDESTWLTNKLYVLTSPDIRLGDETVTEQAVLGTTYREKEGTMNSDLAQALQDLSNNLNEASIKLAAAAADPVFAALCSGAAAMVGQAATSIAGASTQAAKMSNAISTFESSSQEYLSHIVKVG